MKKLMMALVAMSLLSAGGAALACGPYGAELSPQEEAMRVVNVLEFELQVQRSVLEDARQQRHWSKVKTTLKHIAALELEKARAQQRYEDLARSLASVE